jgi:uncharacterized DUF497 family protein
MSKLEKIRQYIKEQNYRITIHAQQEANNDNLTKKDIEYAILNGKITKKLTHDPRGARYVVTGMTSNNRIVSVVCRFLETGKLSIITVYRKEGDKNVRKM